MEFGELVEPISRAFWDDIDDADQAEAINLELKWISKTNFPENIKLFVILEGSKISQLVKKNLLKDCILHCEVIGIKVSIYSIYEKDCLICISEENNLSLSGCITNLMIEWLQKSKEVVTISIQPQATYKSMNSAETSNAIFSYGINSKIEHIKELESPNFITGLSAAVASWRYVKKLQISSYILYITDFDEMSTLDIIRFLKDIGLHFGEKLNFQQELSNLYT